MAALQVRPFFFVPSCLSPLFFCLLNLKAKKRTDLKQYHQCLDEILRDQGGLQCDQALSIYLLNRIGDFNEWGTASVVQLVSRYNPQDTKEVFDIMNVLDPCLRQTNSAVVLGAVSFFNIYIFSIVKHLRLQRTGFNAFGRGGNRRKSLSSLQSACLILRLLCIFA